MKNNAVEDIKSIEEFLGKNRIDDLKDYVVEKMKENLEDSIDYHWIINPSEFDSIWDSIFIKVAKDIKKEYTDSLTIAFRKKVESYIKSAEKELINDTIGDSTIDEIKSDIAREINKDPHALYTLKKTSEGYSIYKTTIQKNGKIDSFSLVNHSSKDKLLNILKEAIDSNEELNITISSRAIFDLDNTY